MSVFASQIRNKPFVGPVTLLAVVLGGLLALSLKGQDNIRQQHLPGGRGPGLAAAYVELRDTVAEQNKQIADLRTNLARYQKAAADESASAKLLSADLQKANVLSGLVALSGPGVEIVLSDSKKPRPNPDQFAPNEYQEILSRYLIHDQDVQAVLNELKAAGAEAIAINGQRVLATTAVRCVGPVVKVNDVPTSVPVRIEAIGDPQTLHSGLTMPGGVQDAYGLEGDPSMFKIEKKKNVVIPAYNGPTPLRFAKIASEASAAQAQKKAEEATKSEPAAKQP